MVETQEQNIKYLVRIANTDLDGHKQIFHALRKIRGISFMVANFICKVANIDPARKSGTLSNEEVARISQIIENPFKYDMPVWLCNRKRDPETGKDQHLILGDLQFSRETDIKMMKKMKCYKGVRHILGQPVRGQSTKSNFRKNKGRVTGVVRAKVTAPSEGKKSEGKESKK